MLFQRRQLHLYPVRQREIFYRPILKIFIIIQTLMLLYINATIQANQIIQSVIIIICYHQRKKLATLGYTLQTLDA